MGTMYDARARGQPTTPCSGREPRLSSDRGGQACDPFVQRGVPAPLQVDRFREFHTQERHPFAGTQLAELVEVGADDLGDLRVASDRLAIDAEHDALAVPGHLNRAWTYRLRHHLSARKRERQAFQTQTHAVARRLDDK